MARLQPVGTKRDTLNKECALLVPKRAGKSGSLDSRYNVGTMAPQGKKKAETKVKKLNRELKDGMVYRVVGVGKKK